MNDYRVRLGFRDPASDKYVGSDENWNKAEAALESVTRNVSPQLHHRTRGGRVLWTEGRFRGLRLPGPRMAAGHRATGLQSAEHGRFAPGIRRRRQPAPSAGDDPSGAVRLAGAVRGRVDRALRRRVSAVAGPRAGPRAGRQPEVRGRTPARSKRGSGRPASA